MNITSLVLSIIGILLALRSFTGWYALPLTLLAVILGVVALRKPGPRGVAVAGIVLGVVGTAMGGHQLSANLRTRTALQTPAGQ